METEVKKPHHFSKEAREARAKDEKDELVGEETSNPTPKAESQEHSIPLSQVEAMIAKALAGIAQQAPPPPQQPIYYQPKPDNDVDDIPEFKEWEMRDREYELCDGTKPISCSIPVEHRKEIPLQYTNKDTKSIHIMRYSTNQPSFFVEKQSKEIGSVLLSEIIFNYGRLKTSANDVTLQKFLHIHPYKDILFKEYDPNAISRKKIEDKKLALRANTLLFSNSETVNRAIASVICPDYIISWTKDTLEERLLSEIELDVKRFIKLAEDPDTKVKGVIKTALAEGDLSYVNYRFTNKNKEVLVEVGRNEDELEAMVSYLASGNGRSFYEFLLNK